MPSIGFAIPLYIIAHCDFITPTAHLNVRRFKADAIDGFFRMVGIPTKNGISVMLSNQLLGAMCKWIARIGKARKRQVGGALESKHQPN
ncbi:MAG TPA: hypothetical protein EYP10_15720 [Armatimonadetes bacterium]|nr:hypothetical protein [Armatimonadota bacterium]